MLKHLLTLIVLFAISINAAWASDVADGNQSIILNQVENGVAVRMAVLYLLSGRGN